MELARGGPVEGGKDLPPVLIHNRDHIIPRRETERWKELLLRINEFELDKPDEDVID